MLQLRNKPTLSPKQLEADKTLSSEVLEKQQFRVLLASSGRRDNTGRMLRGRNKPSRRKMWRELEREWLRSHGEIEQRQIRHIRGGIQSIWRDLGSKQQNKTDKSKWLRKENGNEIKWTVWKTLVQNIKRVKYKNTAFVVHLYSTLQHICIILFNSYTPENRFYYPHFIGIIIKFKRFV